MMIMINDFKGPYFYSNLCLNYLLLDIISIAYLLIYQLLLWIFYKCFIPDPLNVLLGLVIDVFLSLKKMKDIYSDVIVTMVE